MKVLGISCDYHDAAAALVIDGDIIAASEEERFSRHKHDASVPERSIASCLAIAGLTPDDLDAVVMHEKPLVVLSRVLAARQRRGPAALGSFTREFPTLLRRNFMVANRIDSALRRVGASKSIPLRYSEHHLSHAAAAFLPSPFETAAVLTVDGIGEWSTATLGHGVKQRVDILAEQRYPNSIGLLYSLATIWCGFEANEGEYKLMGLAPFGQPRFADALREIVELHDDGSMTVDAKAVRWWGGDPRRMSSLVELFDGPPRGSGEPVTERDADLARSIQELVETAVLRMANHLHELTGERNLCMAGGVALNCVANGRLLRDGPFDEVWVQPAAGDAGSALGAALWYSHDELGLPRRHLSNPLPAGDEIPGDGAPRDAMQGAALGPSFSSTEIGAWLDAESIEHTQVADRSELVQLVAEQLGAGSVVGWFEGRMEFGPRSLGHRSILADPRSESVQRDINLRVKGRESFRPFAPAVLAEHAAEWFDMEQASPYMLITFPVTESQRLPVDHEPSDPIERVQVPRSAIPACTHVDGSARVQTVHRSTAPAFWELLTAFHAHTGCPVLLNTSFNVAGEPIVCTPEDALRTARSAGMDLLVLEDRLIYLNDQAPETPPENPAESPTGDNINETVSGGND